MAKSGHKGISRIEQPKRKTIGWYVRITFNSQQHSKFFSDHLHGGTDKALEAAIAHRNQIEVEWGKPRTERLVIAHNSRNRTGIMGVRRRTKIIKTEHGERVTNNVYEVTWNPEPGRLCRTWVSIDEYGEEAALRKACAIRREKEREMFGDVVKPNWSRSLKKFFSA